MVSDPDLVLYTCIAHHHNIDSPESTILAEFNSVDSSLQELAQQCLYFTPPHHTNFSQTFRNQTYTFLLDYPFVYFGIFNPKMIKFDQMKLLDSLKETLNHIIKGKFDQKFTSYCFQGELHPIFHKLLSKSLDVGANNLTPLNGVHYDHDGNGDDNKISVTMISSSDKGRKIMALPMLNCCKIGKGFKKKRMSSDSVMDSGEVLIDGKVDVLDDNVVVGQTKSREIICENGVCLLGGHASGNANANTNANANANLGRQKAKKIWRRHVWIVLVLDLAVCLILFGIWLFVCRGFECVEG